MDRVNRWKTGHREFSRLISKIWVLEIKKQEEEEKENKVKAQVHQVQVSERLSAAPPVTSGRAVFGLQPDTAPFSPKQRFFS